MQTERLGPTSVSRHLQETPEDINESIESVNRHVFQPRVLTQEYREKLKRTLDAPNVIYLSKKKKFMRGSSNISGVLDNKNRTQSTGKDNIESSLVPESCIEPKAPIIRQIKPKLLFNIPQSSKSPKPIFLKKSLPTTDTSSKDHKVVHSFHRLSSKDNLWKTNSENTFQKTQEEDRSKSRVLGPRTTLIRPSISVRRNSKQLSLVARRAESLTDKPKIETKNSLIEGQILKQLLNKELEKPISCTVSEFKTLDGPNSGLLGSKKQIEPSSILVDRKKRSETSNHNSSAQLLKNIPGQESKKKVVFSKNIVVFEYGKSL